MEKLELYLRKSLKNSEIDYSKEYFYIQALEDGMQVKFTRNLEYSLNTITWSTLTGKTNSLAISKYQKIYFKNSTKYSPTNTFTINKRCNVGGNIMSLIFGDDFIDKIDLTGYERVFYELFNNCKTIQSAKNLILPATTLARYCYGNMFKGCTKLTEASELPATNLAEACYLGMFQDCTSLTAPPELPATTLPQECYTAMFEDCISLINAPSILPATTLNYRCCSSMFRGCTKLKVAPELPATTLANNCYGYMFEGCTGLTTAPELPATTLANYCYQNMFQGCTSLTEAPALTATILASSCYSGMLSGTNVLPDCSNIDFSSSEVIASGGLGGLFMGTKVNDEDLFNILPVNENGKYYLPATTLANYCYAYMFSSCKNLTTAPELPATKAEGYCYRGMFSGCTSLINTSKLPATKLSMYCYTEMFRGCTSLEIAPELPATNLVQACYDRMFEGCTKLRYVKALVMHAPSTNYSTEWLEGVSNTGIFVKNPAATWNSINEHSVPEGWVIEYDCTLIECTKLTITANNVRGRDTHTTIQYTAICKGINENNEIFDNLVISNTVISDEFPQNTSYTNTVTRVILFTFMGASASTNITQDVWKDQAYEIDLNSNWELSTTIGNPDSTLYDGVYQSFSNKGQNSTAAKMYIDIAGYTDFTLYIRSYAESSYDYVMVSQLDKDINNNSSYSDTSLVKAHTRGKSTSSTSISDYTKVEFSGIDTGEHRITIVYRKNSSGNSGDDRGYLLIPKNQ